LNVEQSRILQEALNINLLPLPKKIPSPPNVDPNKYCRYHGNYGHVTKECVALKNKIEKLSRAGHLKQFMRRQLERRD